MRSEEGEMVRHSNAAFVCTVGNDRATARGRESCTGEAPLTPLPSPFPLPALIRMLGEDSALSEPHKEAGLRDTK